MSNDSNIFQFDPGTVSRLFRLCDQPDEGGQARPPEPDKTELLRALLDDMAPSDHVALAGIPDSLRHMHQVLPHVHGQSLGQVLQDPATPLAELRSIKGYAKDSMSKAGTEGQREAAGVIYYVAIARAIVRYDTRITQHSYRQLLDFFASLLTKEWIPGDIKSLFEETRDQCARHSCEDQASD